MPNPEQTKLPFVHLCRKEAYTALFNNEFDPDRVYELTVTWPTTGKRMTYLARTAEQHQHLTEVVESAKDQEAECVLRSYFPSAIHVKQYGETSDHDAVLWQKGKLSMRAIDQFRRFADENLQGLVASKVEAGELPLAVEVLKPYSAYRVQALSADEGGKTLAIDFDATIASYEPDQYPAIGTPLPGAIEALKTLKDEGYQIVILSSRALHPEGKTAILDWLDQYGAPDVIVTGEKVPAELYVDDRGVHFTDWSEALKQIRERTRVGSLLCQSDHSILEYHPVGKKMVCPACDAETPLLQTVVASVWSLTPGDKVCVSSTGGRTSGDAYLICKASAEEEAALGGSNLWLVKFADGACLPVGESYLSKIGHSEDVAEAARAVVNGDSNRLAKLGDLPMKYDLDKVVESALTDSETQPPDTVLVTLGARHGLSADDLDFVAEQLVASESKIAEKLEPSYTDMLDSVRDAVAEYDARCRASDLASSSEEETQVVLGCLAEEFDLNDELLDVDLVTKVRDLIAQVRLGKTSELQDYHPTDLPAKTSVPESDYDVVRNQTTADAGKDGTVKIKVKDGLLFYYNGKFTKDVVGTIMADTIARANGFSYAEEFVRQYDGKTLTLDGATWKIVDDGALPSRTAEGDLCLNCGSVWQEGTPCCEQPRKGPGEGPVQRGDVKEAYTGSECVSCGKFVPMHNAVENEHGAGYLCKSCAPAWNKDVSNEEFNKTRETVTASVSKKSDAFMRGNAYVMQYLDDSDAGTYEMKDILESSATDDEKYEQIKARIIKLIQEKSDDEATIKQVDWDAPEVRTDIVQMIEDYNEEKRQDEEFEAGRGPEASLRQTSTMEEFMQDTTRTEMTPEEELEYATYILEHNFKNTDGTPKFKSESEREYYQGKLKRLPHGVSREIWQKAYTNVFGSDVVISDKTLDEVSKEMTGKTYRELPDDGPEQENVMSEFQRLTGKPSPYATGSKKAILDNSLKGQFLDEQQRQIVASITQQIDEYTPDFLRSVGQFFTYEWDPGASWEVRDVEGKKQIVRAEPKRKEQAVTKHSFHEGQVLKFFTTFYPTDVKITALLGEDRYRVKSLMDGASYDVDEEDLCVVDSTKSLF